MDALANGRRIKCLIIVDDFSRECVDIAVDYGIGGEYVSRVLDGVGQFRCYPKGDPDRPRAGVHQKGLYGLGPRPRGIKHLINDAGKPTQNAYIESVNGKFRDGA